MALITNWGPNILSRSKKKYTIYIKNKIFFKQKYWQEDLNFNTFILDGLFLIGKV